MGKLYYAIDKGNLLGGSPDKGLAFLTVSGNRIRHIAGDKSLTKTVEFREGKLIKKNPDNKYNIISLTDIQFDIYKERLNPKRIEEKEFVEEKS